MVLVSRIDLPELYFDLWDVKVEIQPFYCHLNITLADIWVSLPEIYHLSSPLLMKFLSSITVAALTPGQILNFDTSSK